MVPECDRAQHHRHRARSRHSARQRHTVEIAAQEVEPILHELEAAAVEHVRRVDDEEGFARHAAQVAKGGALEQLLVEVFGQQVAAAKAWRLDAPQAAWRQHPGCQALLQRCLEEVRLERGHAVDAIQRIGRGQDAAARDAHQEVDLIDQPLRATLPDDGCVAQGLEHAEAEGRRARAATRERQVQDEGVVGLAGQHPVGPVATIGIDAVQARVHRVVRRAAPGQHRSRQQRKHDPDNVLHDVRLLWAATRCRFSFAEPGVRWPGGRPRA